MYPLSQKIYHQLKPNNIIREKSHGFFPEVLSRILGLWKTLHMKVCMGKL